MKTPERNSTGANRGNRERRYFSVLSVSSCSNPGVLGKPELREYKAVFVVGDAEVSQFSDEIIINCAPLV